VSQTAAVSSAAGQGWEFLLSLAFPRLKLTDFIDRCRLSHPQQCLGTSHKVDIFLLLEPVQEVTEGVSLFLSLEPVGVYCQIVRSLVTPVVSVEANRIYPQSPYV